MKFILYSRRYSPFNTFGGGFKGDGDNRLYSDDVNSTSRTSGQITITYDLGKFGVSNPVGKSSGSHHSLSGNSRFKAKGKVAVAKNNVVLGVNHLKFTL